MLSKKSFQQLDGNVHQRKSERGFFNFVGETTKTLFVTLSESDATYYNT